MYIFRAIANEVDELIGGRIVRCHLCSRLQLWLDHLRQLFAQLNTVELPNYDVLARKHCLPPLVVAVDVPDGALHEDLVLIACDKSAQRMWCHFR